MLDAGPVGVFFPLPRSYSAPDDAPLGAASFNLFSTRRLGSTFGSKSLRQTLKRPGLPYTGIFPDSVSRYKDFT